MKKKEILIIFVLAVLVTGGSWFVRWRSMTCAVVTCIGVNTFCHGFPLTFAMSYQLSPRYTLDGIGSCSDLPGHTSWIPLFLVLDFLFWFLSLTIGYRLIKWVRQRFSKKVG